MSTTAKIVGASGGFMAMVFGYFTYQSYQAAGDTLWTYVYGGCSIFGALAAVAYCYSIVRG